MLIDRDAKPFDTAETGWTEAGIAEQNRRAAVEHRPHRIIFTMPWKLGGNLANVGRLILAVLWTLLWGTWRWTCRPRHGWTYRQWRVIAFTWGRRHSPKAVRCEDCGWVGPLKWAVHTYQNDHCGDVEPVDECPRCGVCESLHPVLKRSDGAWAA